MIKLIRNNQKTVLTGLTIFSMVAFLVNRGNGTKDGSSDRVFATANGQKIYLSEFQEARAEQQALRQYFLFDPRQSEVSAVVNGKDELFMLLRHEANQLGIHANKDEVQTILKNETRPLDVNSDEYTLLSNGVGDLLKIMTRVTMLAQAEKTSRPQVDQQLALDDESLKVKLVQFQAADFADKVPAPTPQQVQEQFTKYASTVPRQPNETDNPFGFGYKLPQRAAFQYIRVTDDELNQAAIATEDAYTWDVDAHKYYYKHLSDYPATVPTTGPIGPMLPKRFDEVKGVILEKLHKEKADDLRTQVTLFITSTMNADWQNYSKFIAGGAKGAEPDSSLGEPYTSFKYLIKLDEAVHTKFNVEVTDHTTDYLPERDFNTPELDYSTLAGVGSAAVTTFITNRCNEYLDLKKENDPTAPATLVEPSASLAGPQEGIRVFIRLTDVKPAEAPADVSVVRAEVESDIRIAKAYDLAKQQADALALAAKAGTLDIAAAAVGRSEISTEVTAKVLANDPAGQAAWAKINQEVKPPLHDNDRLPFVKQAYKLLTVYDAQRVMHPVGVIELQSLPNSRVMVGQLQSLSAEWDDKSFFDYYALACQNVHKRSDQMTAFESLALPNVIARLDYKPLKGN
jgi:hypothetical protein